MYSNDILLEEVFKPWRWEQAIHKGILKDINKVELRMLCETNTRLELYFKIKDGQYAIMFPHQGKIPKNKQKTEFRTVWINENRDRVLLSIINDLFFEMFHDMIHPACKSYQSGIGCGKVVQEVSYVMSHTDGMEVAVKEDLVKYFDSVPLRYIDDILDRIEEKVGKSRIIDLIREYYHSNYCFDLDMNLIEHYQSLKQGCALAAFFADVVLYDIDKAISELDVYYVRYSDDVLIVGPEWRKGKKILIEMLTEMELSINPKKEEIIRKDTFFKFLGFNIKGDKISLSESRIKTFQEEIVKRTIYSKSSFKKALNDVIFYLYKGDGTYSWSTSVLPIINIEQDIQTLNCFVMDCLRACKVREEKTNPKVRKRKIPIKEIGGLGCVKNLKTHTILRGKGSSVKNNRIKTDMSIPKYKTLNCMRNAMLISRDVYDTLVREM